MLDQSLRVYKEELLTPIADQLLSRDHPTTITLIGFRFGVVAGIGAWQGMIGLRVLFWSLNRIFGGFDGTVARRYNKQSDVGGYIDILLDDVIYTLIVIMLAISVNTIPVYIAALFLLASYRVNAASWMYLSSLLEKRAQGAKTRGEYTSITMPPGLIEGTETVIAYFLFLLFPAYLLPMYWVFGTLVFVTVGQRIWWAVRNID